MGMQEVKACSQLLLDQLLTRLSSNVMLPESLRSISYIRRIAAFSEVELRHRFLQCRETWYVTPWKVESLWSHSPCALFHRGKQAEVA